MTGGSDGGERGKKSFGNETILCLTVWETK